MALSNNISMQLFAKPNEESFSVSRNIQGANSFFASNFLFATMSFAISLLVFPKCKSPNAR